MLGYMLNITGNYLLNYFARWTLAFFLCLLIIPIQVFAAAWVQPKGEGILITPVQPTLSCQYWDKQSKLKRGPCFHQFAINPYAEYGYSSKLTVVFSPTFLSYRQSNQSSPFALGYIVLGGRYLVSERNNHSLSLQLLYNQPFKSNKFGSHDDTSTQYALGNEEYYVDARVLYGIKGQVNKTNNFWYANAETAFRPYFQGAASEFHIDLTTGVITHNGKVVFEVQELNTLSTHDPANYQQPNYNVYTIIPNLTYWFKANSAVQLGLKQDFYGNNTGRGTAPFVSFWIKF
jgi:hypothetical protein